MTTLFYIASALLVFPLAALIADTLEIFIW